MSDARGDETPEPIDVLARAGTDSGRAGDVPPARRGVDIGVGTEGTVVHLRDRIEGVDAYLQTSDPVSPSPSPASSFAVPVDTAVELETGALRVPQLSDVVVRDGDGRAVAQVQNTGSERLQPGTYTVDVTSLGMKTYVRVDGALAITSDTGRGTDYRVLRTTDPPLRLGVRSYHDRPAASVTAGDDPRSAMRALSTFGSALKTTACERTYATLRGHPPLVVRGEEFAAPSGLERRPGDDDVAVTVEVPATVDAVFPVASLAYYLDAAVAPLPSDARGPRLLIDTVDGEWTYPLATDREPFEERVRRTLEHVFALDCLVRTEGLYPLDLGERDRLPADLDCEALYGRPLGDQLRAYLDVDPAAVAGIAPRWQLTADVEPVAGRIGVLPFVAADLGHVRTGAGGGDPGDADAVDAIDEFCRDGHSAPGSDLADEALPRIVTPPPADSVEHLWYRSGYPLGAARTTPEAAARRLEATGTGPVRAAVVVNDDGMDREIDVADLYRLREFVQVEIDVHRDLGIGDLRAVFAEPYDLVHYVGHVTERGLQCADGHLDDVAARSFFLNACRSYRQGAHLVEAGAVGGVVTLGIVRNASALDVGRQTARLLGTGFSLGGALEILSDHSMAGSRYTVVGDPRLTVTDPPASTPILAAIERVGEGAYAVGIEGYPSSHAPLGSLYAPNLGENTTHHLNSGRIADAVVRADTLEEWLARARFPVTVDGRLHWSDDLTAADLREN